MSRGAERMHRWALFVGRRPVKYHSGKMKVVRAPRFAPSDDGALRIDASAVADWLVRFLVQECRVRRKTDRVVLGLSGGVDSAVSAAL